MTSRVSRLHQEELRAIARLCTLPLLGRQRLECGERTHVPDAGAVGEEHDEAVDANTLQEHARGACSQGEMRGMSTPRQGRPWGALHEEMWG